MTAEHACDGCLARAWLLSRLAGHLEPVRARLGELLGLGDDELIAAVGGQHRDSLRREFGRFDARDARARVVAAGLQAICCCHRRYPDRLYELEGPPAVLHVAGELERFLELVREDPVGIVGARRASGYGTDVARSLGRGLGAAGVTVVSGMALGVDAASHAGALTAGAGTVAVLPAGAERPYPSTKRALHRHIQATGAAISELPPGSGLRRWMFPARNRVIAALTAMTVVVEASERSGSLVTARVAGELGRPIGAVPGRVTSPLAVGSNNLLACGALLVRGPQDVLDQLFGAGVRTATPVDRPPLEPGLQDLLSAIADGTDTSAALHRAGLDPGQGLAALAALELGGYVRREPGGRFSVLP